MAETSRLDDVAEAPLAGSPPRRRLVACLVPPSSNLLAGTANPDIVTERFGNRSRVPQLVLMLGLAQARRHTAVSLK
jgi:hypothetical protein